MNVLIVDDHEIVRDGLALLIHDFFENVTFLFASEGREAMQKALRHPDLDLIILDLSMPEGMDGLQTASEIRCILPNAKIVLFSMHDEEFYQRKAYAAGVDGYLIKRLKGEEIIHSLENIIHGQKVFSKQLSEEQTTKQITENHWDLPISNREKEVFQLSVAGYSQKEIASKLNISAKTVEHHRHNIGRKLGISKKNEWIELAKKYQIL